MSTRSILWRRFDPPGYDFGSFTVRRSGLCIRGSAIFAFRGKPVGLHYLVEGDGSGRTRRVEITGHVGSKPVAVSIAVDRARRWRIDRRASPAVEGCDDVDLSFSPCTNTLPIRRLALRRGASAAVRAAWLGFPDFKLHVLRQVYRRTSRTAYRYSTSGGFAVTLTVDGDGLVTRYGRQWKVVARH
jgi:hypothetical protein